MGEPSDKMQGGGWPSGQQGEHQYGKTTSAPQPPEGWPRGVPYNPQSKDAKPTLTGHRNASRKRGNEAQKKKAEPAEFVAGLAEICNPNLNDKEQCFKLIQSQNFDFETYGETFWEALITGGILKSGGSMDEAVTTPCALNVFDSALEDVPAISHLAAQVLQRHRHLRPVLDTVLCRITLWVDRYDEERQQKLSNFITTHCIAHGAGLLTVATLQVEKRLVESGAALSFCCRLFKEFLSRATVEKLNRALKDGKALSIINLLPSNKRTPANLYTALTEEGLPGFAKWMKTQTRDKRVEDLQEKMDEELSDINCLEETAQRFLLFKSQYVLSDADVVVCLFRAIMTLVDLSNEKTMAKDMTAHLLSFVELLEPFCKTLVAEKNLIEALLNYVQDDERLFDGFMVTCKEMYDADILGEDAIIAWVEHKKGQADGDMEPYLTQMQPFVDWLEEADESDSDDEE